MLDFGTNEMLKRCYSFLLTYIENELEKRQRYYGVQSKILMHCLVDNYLAILCLQNGTNFQSTK